MTRTENRHFDLNRILLIIIGLWPYKQSNLVRLQLILFFGILMSFIIFQLSRFMIVDCTFDFVLKILSFTLIFVMYAIKYNSFWINMKTVRCLLDQVECIYEELTDENEIAILEKYIISARRYTCKIIILVMCGMFALVCFTCSPHILDIIMSKNGTYSRRFLKIVGQYFAVSERYIYLIMLHMNAASCIGGIALVATGTMIITYLKQACGMFRIASYRIKRAMTISILQNVSSKNELVMCRGIMFAVDIHRKAMEFPASFISDFEGMLLSLIAVAVCCLSLNLFQVSQMVSYADQANEFLILHAVFVIVMLLYMFLVNFAGQEITDHSNDIYLAAYNVEWYLAPVHVQKLILFVLQRGSKRFSLNVGGLVAGSLECFASLTSASISYFTVMYATQK